jgi:polyphosphate kinase
MPGISERIRVVSIVGRFLEHSRLFYFSNTEGGYFIGSADWMPRNLDRRVEAVTPVEDRSLHARLRAVLETSLADNRQAWDLRPDGTYVQRSPGDEPERGTHRLLLRDPWGLEASPDRLTTRTPEATRIVETRA